MDDLKLKIRTIPNFPIPGIQYRDITGLLEDPKSFKEAIIDMTSEAMQFKVQTIIGIENITKASISLLIEYGILIFLNLYKLTKTAIIKSKFICCSTLV